MKTKKILLTVSITLTTILLIQLLKKNKAKKRLDTRLRVVADEGYETAEDILFPKKKFLL